MTKPSVINAARDFVCIRLATYEDKEEGEYLKSFGAGRSGVLANTVFCFLSPNGEEISRASRGPNQLFRDASQMASYMKEVAAKYAAKETTTPTLPKLKDVRLALNVAECDAQPLVVAFGDPATLAKIDVSLAQAAFSETLRGRFVFATTSDASELERIGMRNDNGGSLLPGIYVIDPDQFGLKGKEIAKLPLESDQTTVVQVLGKVANDTGRDRKSRRDHVRTGAEKNATWKTEIPVTDPGSLKAMERRKNSGRRQ